MNSRTSRKYRLGLLVAALALVVSLPLPVHAEDTPIKDAAKQAGRDAKAAGKKIGKTAKEVGKDIGQTSKRTYKSIKNKVRKDFSDVAEKDSSGRR